MYPHAKEFGLLSNIYIKINSKWTIDLNVEVKAVRLLEVSVGVSLCDFGLGNDSLDTTPRAQVIKS